MGKKRTEISVFFVLVLAVLLLNSQNATAATVTLNIDGGQGTFTVDNHGGDEGYNKLYWDNNTNYHTSSTFLAVYDMISGNLDNSKVPNHPGGGDVDDSWNSNKSGIMRHIGPFPPGGWPQCVGEVAAHPNGPGVPVTFTGKNTGLDVEMIVFGGANAPFAINAYLITNNTGTTKDIKVAHFNDFDVNGGSDDHDKGYDEDNQLVWQWDKNDGGYIAGSALLEGKVSNWFSEFCCTMSYGDGNGYPDQMGFFTDDPKFNGEKSFKSGDDLEVDIATDLGKLDPGESAWVAFVTAAAPGNTSGTALDNLRDVIEEALACYEAIFPAPPDLEEDDYPEFFKKVFPGVYMFNKEGSDSKSSGCFLDTLLN